METPATMKLQHPDGRVIEVIVMLYGKGRITISQSEGCGYYDDNW